MKMWMGVGSIVLALVLAAGCSSQDSARNREEQEKAQRQLDSARDKLRQGLKSADEQTREDLDKARTQVRQALSQSERDAERARDKLREREDHQNNPPDNYDSHH
jgi:septal ring factor EnvC (AmiA/AmiB activator)